MRPGPQRVPVDLDEERIAAAVDHHGVHHLIREPAAQARRGIDEGRAVFGWAKVAEHQGREHSLRVALRAREVVDDRRQPAEHEHQRQPVLLHRRRGAEQRAQCR